MGLDYRRNLSADFFPALLGAPAWEEQQAMISPCKDCERRTVHPNCHSTCEEYKNFSQERRDLSEKRLELSRGTDHCCEKFKRLKKRTHRR